MKVVLIGLLFLFAASCSKSSAPSQAVATKAATVDISSQVNDVNAKFNSDQLYSLSSDELQILVDDGLITQEEYTQLTQVSK